jgi:hypothetical protein
MRETKKRKKKEERRETKEIKTEIRPSQLQTVITFDRKLRLRRAMRSRKACDDIYMLTTISIIAILGAKKYRLDPKRCI